MSRFGKSVESNTEIEQAFKSYNIPVQGSGYAELYVAGCDVDFAELVVNGNVVTRTVSVNGTAGDTNHTLLNTLYGNYKCLKFLGDLPINLSWIRECYVKFYQSEKNDNGAYPQLIIMPTLYEDASRVQKINNSYEVEYTNSEVVVRVREKTTCSEDTSSEDPTSEDTNQQ